MSGFDQRVATALSALGYDVFPFEAFDGSGRIIIPDRVQYPTYLKDGLRTIAEAGAWAEIYRTASVLGRAPWNAFMVGLGFTSKTVNVAIFKAASSVATAEEAHQWTVSYQTTIAETLRKFAGTHHVVDPKWIEWLKDAMDRLPSSGKAVDPVEIQPVKAPIGDDPPAAGPGMETIATPTLWLGLGLRVMLGVLEKLALMNGIRTTIFWYSTQGQVLDRRFAGSWKPLHIDYITYPNKRAVHGLWEPAAVPHFWVGSEVNWSRFSWAMPHQLWQWCRVFYPAGACGGPGLADELTAEAGGAVTATDEGEREGSTSISDELRAVREETAQALGLSFDEVDYITEEFLEEFAKAPTDEVPSLLINSDGSPFAEEGETPTIRMQTYGNSLAFRKGYVLYRHGDRGPTLACGTKYWGHWGSQPGDEFNPQPRKCPGGYTWWQLLRPY